MIFLNFVLFWEKAESLGSGSSVLIKSVTTESTLCNLKISFQSLAKMCLIILV